MSPLCRLPPPSADHTGARSVAPSWRVLMARPKGRSASPWASLARRPRLGTTAWSLLFCTLLAGGAGCEERTVGGCGDGACDQARGEDPGSCPADCAWRDISAAAAHTCALRRDGTVWCWGSNAGGELGTGNVTGPETCLAADGSSYACATVPAQVALLQNVTSLSHGASMYGRTTCAVRGDGTAWCWGDNRYGQIGNGTTGSAGPDGHGEPLPSRVSDLTGVVRISTGAWGHSCAVREDGTAWCWGWNGCGQLGTGDATGPELCEGWNGHAPCSTRPVEVQGLHDVVDISVGGYEYSSFTCAVTGDGRAWCWGDNYSGNLGLGHRDTTLQPTPVVDLTDVVAISAGPVQTCATMSDGAGYCWGENLHCELGLGDNTGPQYCAVQADACSMTPARLAVDEPLIQVGAGYLYDCAVSAAGEASCWGLNSSVLSLDPPLAVRCSPQPVTALGTVARLSAGAQHACAVRDDGSAWCWGVASGGRLGYAVAPVLSACPWAPQSQCTLQPTEVAPPQRRSAW